MRDARKKDEEGKREGEKDEEVEKSEERSRNKTLFIKLLFPRFALQIASASFSLSKFAHSVLKMGRN